VTRNFPRHRTEMPTFRNASCTTLYVLSLLTKTLFRCLGQGHFDILLYVLARNFSPGRKYFPRVSLHQTSNDIFSNFLNFKRIFSRETQKHICGSERKSRLAISFRMKRGVTERGEGYYPGSGIAFPSLFLLQYNDIFSWHNQI
jgi:hypothetical protein